MFLHCGASDHNSNGANIYCVEGIGTLAIAHIYNKMNNVSTLSAAAKVQTKQSFKWLKH